ncbi:MAG: xylulose kinase [Polyangiaceae bacterium]|nr:xylulose kinase [Polyangiaceae bacterium]
MTGGDLVLGVDVSTTAAKAIVVDAGGRTQAEGKASFPLDNPSPGAWEQDALAWKEATFRAISAAIAMLDDVDRKRVRTLAIAQQRETFVVTDRDGTPLAPAIVWMDARSKPEVATVSAELTADAIHELSGKVPCTTPSLYKIRMLLGRLRPALQKAPKRLLDVHAFVVHALTGRFVTSTAAADPLGIVDMRRAEWSEPLYRAALLERDSLCDLVEPGAPIGNVLPEVATALGLSRDVLVVGGAGDGQAAGLGAGATSDGTAYLNVGTAVVAGVPARKFRVSRAFRTLFGAMPGTYLYESDLKGGTLTLDWLADRILGGGRFERTDARTATLAALEEKARALPAGAGGLLALPYWAGVMNPHWDDDAGGALVGLRADHGPEHLYRAICEGLGFEHRLVFELIEKETQPISSIVAVGGATKSAFLLNLFSTVLDRALLRSDAEETTALGAAILAAPHAGLHDSIEIAARAMVRVHPGAQPGPDAERYRELYERGYRGLYTALAPLLATLSSG